MRLTTICLVLLLAISTKSFSQYKGEPNTTDVTIVNFLSPGVSYEKTIGKFQTLFGRAYASGSLNVAYSDYFGDSFYFTVDPAATLQYRYYYNYTQRRDKGKRTDMNSLNYISPTFETVFTKEALSDMHYTEEHRRPVSTVGLLWGMQRNYEKRFSLDLSLGLGYLFAKATIYDYNGQSEKINYSKVATMGHFTLGFWLNKRK
jgi:hypothetical protein